jgi:hypothetical protein
MYVKVLYFICSNHVLSYIIYISACIGNKNTNYKAATNRQKTIRLIKSIKNSFTKSCEDATIYRQPKIILDHHAGSTLDMGSQHVMDFITIYFLKLLKCLSVHELFQLLNEFRKHGMIAHVQNSINPIVCRKCQLADLSCLSVKRQP